MVSVGRLDVLQVLSHASAVIAEGEVHQLKTANNLATTAGEYDQVIGAKTAAFIAAAMRVVPWRRGQRQRRLLVWKPTARSWALHSKWSMMPFDFTSSEADMGKAAGDDFREGKVTLPIILTCAAGDEDQRAFWQRTIERLDQHEGDLDQAMKYLDQHQAITQTLAIAGQAGQRALDAWCPSQMGI